MTACPSTEILKQLLADRHTLKNSSGKILALYGTVLVQWPSRARQLIRRWRIRAASAGGGGVKCVSQRSDHVEATQNPSLRSRKPFHDSELKMLFFLDFDGRLLPQESEG
jgi:hypothetical protein